jgi:hypothetical protein
MNRLLPVSPVIIVAGCGDAAAAGDAVGSACPNRSSPVQKQKRCGRLLVWSVPTARSGPNDLNSQTERDDQSGLRGRNDPSAQNTGRRRDISPSFCPENPSPSINGWHRPGLRPRGKGLRLRLKTGRLRRSRRFSPTMNRSSLLLQLPLLSPRLHHRPRLTKRLRRSITRRRVTTHQALGTANSSACTR